MFRGPILGAIRIALITMAFSWLSLPCCAQTTHPSKAKTVAAEEKSTVEPGVVVEEVEAGREGNKAGLKVGDVLLSWSRGDASGDIASPFDISLLEIEQKPRGPVTIKGLRGTEMHTWMLGPDAWEIQARPNFQGKLLDSYQEGQQLLTAGKLAEAAECWRVLASHSDGSVPVWLLVHTGEKFATEHQWKEADGAYQDAIAQARGAGRNITTILYRIWAQTFYQRSDWTNAEKNMQQAIVESRKLDSESLVIATSISGLGVIAAQRGNLTKAEEYYHQALDIQKKLAPESLAIASTFDSLGVEVKDRGRLSEAEEYLLKALDIRQRLAPASLVLANSFNNLGNVAEERGSLKKAEEYHRQALNIRQKLAPGSLALAASLNNLGEVAEDRGDLAKAEEYYRQSLDIEQGQVPGSLNVAGSLNNLGNISWMRGDLAKAGEYLHQALDIRQKLAPASLVVAESFTSLGIVARQRGELAEAEQYYRQALDIGQRLAPESLVVAGSFSNLGSVAWERGNLATAEEHYRHALEIRQKLAAGSLAVASSFMGLGIVARQRGDLARAEQYHRQALEIREKLAPGSLTVASSLTNLANVADDQGDSAKADECLRQALAIQLKLAPVSLAVAETLTTLGSVAFQRSDLKKAEEYYREALDIQNKLAPGSLDVAFGFDNLGSIAENQENLDEAEKYYRQALHIHEKWDPDSLPYASSIYHLADISKRRNNLAEAEEGYRQALAIREKLAPGSKAHAEALAALAETLQRTGRPALAAQLFEQALNAVERQTARLGGSQEVRSGFRAGFAARYRDYVDLLVTQKQPELAFQVLERSRARALLEMFAEAHLEIGRGVDSRLMEEERTLQGEITAKTSQRIRALSEKHAENQVAAVTREIENLVMRYREAEGQLRAASPPYAALTQPQPLTAKQVQEQLLDPGTLLLEYSLGEERSYVFAVTPDSLQAFELPKREMLEKAARHVYNLLTVRNRTVLGESPVQRQMRLATAEIEYDKAAVALSRMILGPVADQLGDRFKDKRLLIVSDGALAYIPFTALPEPAATRIEGSSASPKSLGTARSASAVPLVVNHEIVNLPSASVLAVLRQQEINRKPPPRAVAVLADPVFDRLDPRVASITASRSISAQARLRRANIPSATHDLWLNTPFSAGLLTRSAADVGLSRNGALSLPRLRYTRREAEAIYAEVPAGSAMKALDFDANRATATSVDLSRYRIVHFATHGLLNSEHPELSGLVLSLVDRDGRPQDGFLGLQDIYNLNLPADLVVLSACETGLGKEISGEGLVGLTRGFMYAGAYRVVASLWKVSDAATANLMAEFYRSMEQDHLAPAAALRQAQIFMWKQKRWSDPYYWAAFQIQGEWK